MFNKHPGLNLIFAGALALAPAVAWAQQDSPPIHKVTVALGRAKAINYRYIGGSARIGFRGTVLLPKAEGKAKVKIHEGGAAIHALFDHLEPAGRFGPEYLTYVLWSITPAGQVANLGELQVKANGDGHIDTATSLQTFGLIVTAEPHFAVSTPSEMLVLENVLSGADPGKVEEVEAQYPLLSRSAYQLRDNPADFQAPQLDKRVSPYVHQARHAMRLAQAAQADSYARDLYLKADHAMARLEAEKKLWKKPAILQARQVVQMAEDARLVAVRNRQELEASQARKVTEQAQAKLEAELQAARGQLEAARVQADTARDRAVREALQGMAGAHPDLLQVDFDPHYIHRAGGPVMG